MWRWSPPALLPSRVMSENIAEHIASFLKRLIKVSPAGLLFFFEYKNTNIFYSHEDCSVNKTIFFIIWSCGAT